MIRKSLILNDRAKLALGLMRPTEHQDILMFELSTFGKSDQLILEALPTGMMILYLSITHLSTLDENGNCDFKYWLLSDQFFEMLPK